jgi:hypothetical protein
MSRIKDTPWIIAHDSTCGELACAMECRRCGVVQKFSIPVSLTYWCAVAKAFRREHERCQVENQVEKGQPCGT